MADSLDSILDDVVGPVNAQGQQASLPPLPVTAPQADTLDAILDEVAGPANPNAATPIRVQQALSAAEDTKPEEEARRNQLAKELGTSPALLPSIPEAEAELRRKKLPIEAARLANESPKTSAWSLVPGNAKIAGETGLAALAALEKEFPTLGYLDKALRSGIALGSAAASKLAEQALSFIYTPEEEIATLAKSKGELERLRALPGAAVGQYARREQARSEAILQTLTPEEKAGHMGKEYFTLDQEKAAYRDPVKMLGDLLQSAPSSAMAAVTVMLTRGAAIAARTEALATGASEQAATQAAIIAAGKTAAAVGGWSEGLITYGQGSLSAASEVEKMALDKIAKSPEFQRYIQLGYDPEVARTLLADKTGELSGAAGGALTGLISAVGGKYLGKIIGENGSWYGRLGKGALLGSTEEGLQSYQEQVAENIAIRKYAEPGREITQGAAEAGAQGAFLGALMEGPMTAASRAQQSVSTRDALNKIALDAASNPIREHSPEPYRNFIDTLTEGRSIREVFIDTDKVREVFEQAGVTERELNKVFPDIAAQLEDGANTDGFVRASTSDLVTKIKTPEILKSILDHARVQEDSGGMSMSFAEAEKFFQTQHEEFTKESVKAAETKARREQHEADMREIRQKIATEIFSSGRYDATVAKTHAVPLAAFYEKQAALFGGTVTAKELYEQYPYQAQSEQGKNEKISYLAEAMDVPSAKGPATKAFTARAVSETKPEVTKQLMRDDKGNYVWHEYQKAQAEKITTPEGRVLTPARFASESDLQAAVKTNPLVIKRPPLKTGGKRGKGAFKQTGEAAQPFYSKLRSALNDAPEKAFTNGAQLKKWLEANAGKLGVKKDEIFWSGINEYLDAVGKVTKADVLAFLDGNGVQVDVKMLGDEVRPSELLDAEEAEFDDLYLRYRQDPDSLTLEEYDRLQELEQRGNDVIQHRPETKFASYQLPGGTNYREMLLTLPLQVKPKEIRQLSDGSWRALSDEGSPSFGSTREQALERFLAQQKNVGAFQSTHFGQPNIAAHVRMNDRVGANGEKVLFVEEVQSDWGQKGKKEGFAGTEEKFYVMNKLSGNKSALFDTKEAAEEYKSGLPENTRRYADVYPSISDTKGVPSAPFVTDTKAWTALAVKHIIRQAVEGGYDSVAWTTGEQQAARYDLSKHVDTIYSGSNGDGTWAISANKGDITVFTQDRLPEKDLPDYVGKDAADKIIASGDGIKLSGLDLKLGGEGMKGYYDGILPQVVNSVFKQLKVDGKVEKLNIGDPEAAKYSVVLDNGKEIKTTDSLKQAEATAAGFDGAVVRENVTHMRQSGFTITPELRAKVQTEGMSLFQTSEGLPPNAEFDPSTLITTFLKDANLSSIIHESGHFYLEVLERLANRPDAPQAIKDDFNLFLNWFGVTPEQWAGMNIEERTPYHEQFAQSQELWMLEGKSPTLAPKMETAFARFRSWMLSVYKSVEQFLRQHPSAGKLNDEVRAAFSRLIASEEAIIEAEKTRGYVPLFATAEEAGMAPEAFNEYLMQNEEATQHAIGTAQKASMRDLKWLSNAKSKSLKKIQAQADGFRNAIREEVTAQVMDEPINRAREFLRKGVMVDPVTGEQQQADKFKLNIADLEAMAKDPHLKGMTAKDGLHPDVVAMQFGYPSGDALLFDLVKAENAQEKIAGLVDQRMLQEHGEMVDARAIDNMVNAAVVNEARARFLATGLKILTKTGAPISQITKAAKLAAEEKIAKIPVKFLRPAQYAAAERRANAAALENAGKDPAAAIRAQRTAIFNNQMYRAALDAQEEFRIGAERAIRATKPAAQKAMGGEHLLQLNALLDRFGIRSKTTLLTETAPRKTLADYAEGEQRQGLSSYLATEAARLSAVSVDIPAWITDEQLSQDYESLTLTQFRELMDAVRAIEILARREREDYMSIRGQTFAEAKAANIARLRQVHPHLFNADGTLKPRAKKQVVTVGRTLDAKVDALHAELYSFETIVNVLEGGELGPLHESLTARMSARQDWKLGRMEQIFKTVEPLFEQYSKLERRAFTRKDIGMETLGFEMTRQGAVMVALYHGSAEGRNRLMNHGWNLETQRKIIDLLEPRDLNVVNGVFKIFDESLWPELSALDERTKGKAAPKVEAVPYTTRSGNVIGGYFKLKYDSAISTSPQNGVEAVNQLMGRTPGGRVTTAQGASVAREETVGENKRPRLDFNVFFETVNEIVNDLAYREAVADTQRMLLDPEMELIIKAASSEEEYNTLVHRIGGVVLGNQEPITFVEKMSSTIRKNTVVVLMSGVYTAMQNYLNFISVGHRVNKANLAVEILRMHGPTGPEAYRFAVKSSEYLRLRHLSYDRSLQENSKKLTVDEPLMPQMSTWLWLIGATDKIVSTVTWNTAYKEGMVKYANDTKQSVEYADHIVRQTLGSGRDFDISRMQEGALRQLLVMFYSFQNSQLQMQMRNATLAKREWNAGGKAKAMSMGLGALLSIVIMPAIFNDIAISMLRGDPRDDDEDLVTRAYHDVALYQMSFIPGLRDVGSFYFREVAGMSSYGFKLSPIESTITGVGKGAKSAAKMWEGESDPKLTGDAIMGLSYTLGLPGLMVKNAVVGAGAWVDNTAGPEAILFGPPKEVRH